MTATSSPKTIVITGASDGIGAAAARKLHADGHTVVIVGRSPQKTVAVASELGVDHYIADFAKLADVRKLAAELDAAYPRIDVLANNAGGIFGDRAKTVDGFEKTFQINHLAPFLLTQLLMDKLIASDASIIQTSSDAARLMGNIDIDDLNLDKGFSATHAYGNAKLENILFTRELASRFAEQGISAVALHPGVVATNFGKESDSWMKHLVKFPLVRAFFRSPEKGADQIVWLAETTPGTDWVSGGYYENRRAAKTHKQGEDPELARQLWTRSEELLSSADAAPAA